MWEHLHLFVQESHPLYAFTHSLQILVFLNLKLQGIDPVSCGSDRWSVA